MFTFIYSYCFSILLFQVVLDALAGVASKSGGVTLDPPALVSKLPIKYSVFRWVFTLKAENRAPLAVVAVLAGFCKEFYFQLEEGAGEQAYKHFQGVLSLKDRHTLGVVKNLIGFNDVHLEPCRDWFAAKAYSQKVETRLAGPWTHEGSRLDPKYQLQAVDFHKWQKRVCRWLLLEPDDRSIVWIYDPDGGNGKTKFVLHMVDNYGAARFNSGKESDIAYSYADEKIVLFDFQRAKGHVNYSTMEDLKNGHLFSGKYESKAKRFNPPHVVVFANWLPDFTAMSTDRWKVYKLKGLKLRREKQFEKDGVVLEL